MNGPLLEKSMDFATQIVLFYEEFSKSKKDTAIAKQLLRSATSVGANILVTRKTNTFTPRTVSFIERVTNHLLIKYSMKELPCQVNQTEREGRML